MVKWIIQKNLIKEATLAKFKAAFQKHSIDFEAIEVIPFSDDLPEFSIAEHLIFYGSTTLMLNAYQAEDYRKGIFYDPVTFSMATYLKHWRTNMLNHDGIVMRLEDFILQKVEEKEKWFIRPDGDGKNFSGMVKTPEELLDWYAQIYDLGYPVLMKDLPIFACEEKVIHKEWRNFIVNGKVIDSSRYVLNGELAINPDDVPTEMLDFIHQQCEQFTPHDIFVMDIAETSQGYSIIECNCFNGTGFYEHDVEKIVKEVSDYFYKM